MYKCDETKAWTRLKQSMDSAVQGYSYLPYQFLRQQQPPAWPLVCSPSIHENTALRDLFECRLVSVGRTSPNKDINSNPLISACFWYGLSVKTPTGTCYAGNIKEYSPFRPCWLLLMQKKTQSRGFAFLTWSGKPGSNRRPVPWQGTALPTELFPQKTSFW